MRYKNLLDMHTHTDNSPDAVHGATLMCEYAVRRGMRAIALTDHCECNLYIADRYKTSVRQAYLEAKKEKNIFAGAIIVVCGVELGQCMQDTKARDDVMAMDFDFTLGSLHNIAGQPDFYFLDFTTGELDPRTVLTAYFDQIYSMVEWNGFDSLAHITYPFRYLPAQNITINPEEYRDRIMTILELLAKNQKALEINTSGLRYDTGIIPPLWIVKAFRELGGKYITIGSDAHNADAVGAYIEDGMALAEAAGFSEITLYQKHEPVLIPIK